MSRRTALAAISPVASEQWGMITAGQARRLGVSRQDLKRLVDDGTLAIADQAVRVYRLTGAPEDPELDPLRAAWLQLGGAKSWHERTTAPDAIVSHRSAAHLRGLGDLIPHQHEFYATTRLRPRRNDIKLRVRSQIAPDSWEAWGGLPVRTAPAIIDDLLTDREDESAVAQVVQDALALGLLHKNALNAIIAPHAVAYGHSDPAEFARVLVGEETRR
ncbi:type IV toxin-antitoxin system AbiEi family antitoxin domain-containing protein [Micromonospora yasonensis]|uniref:type IV toxin-antitoxin system AbiEi family antitoxin domain-containing protein n=1 Tax=Micromonospora yasonensis TaxID=1128667 RepID=UPI002231E366|nr:type IV toxin-antitoxin system AbiEi family antitoxin domain-containing protein [Micromonospora yasonensis]MCW3841688.1 type IV toxin-antitoxin system AbiEi family antitoxin domain-containing protein [Micromonospora yasonensis]